MMRISESNESEGAVRPAERPVGASEPSNPYPSDQTGGTGRRGNVIYHADGTAVHADTGDPVPIGVWLATGTRTDDPYPCRCDPRCRQTCPCRGRADVVDHLPGTCCARRSS